MTPAPHPLEEPLLVTPGVCQVALDPAQFRREQIPRTIYQQRLREAFFEMYGDLTENSVCDALGQISPLERQMRTLGLTSTSEDLKGYCGLIAKARSDWYSGNYISDGGTPRS